MEQKEGESTYMDTCMYKYVYLRLVSRLGRRYHLKEEVKDKVHYQSQSKAQEPIRQVRKLVWESGNPIFSPTSSKTLNKSIAPDLVFCFHKILNIHIGMLKKQN